MKIFKSARYTDPTKQKQVFVPYSKKLTKIKRYTDGKAVAELGLAVFRLYRNPGLGGHERVKYVSGYLMIYLFHLINYYQGNF